MVDVSRILLIAQIDDLDIFRLKIHQYNAIRAVIPYGKSRAIVRIGVISGHLLCGEARDIFGQCARIHKVQSGRVFSAGYSNRIRSKFRQVMAPENSCGTGILSIGQGDIAASHTENEKCQTNHQCACEAFLGLYDILQTITHGGSGGREASRKSSVIPGRTQNQIRVSRSCRSVGPQEYCFIAA